MRLVYNEGILQILKYMAIEENQVYNPEVELAPISHNRCVETFSSFREAVRNAPLYRTAVKGLAFVVGVLAIGAGGIGAQEDLQMCTLRVNNNTQPFNLRALPSIQSDIVGNHQIIGENGAEVLGNGTGADARKWFLLKINNDGQSLFAFTGATVDSSGCDLEPPIALSNISRDGETFDLTINDFTLRYGVDERLDELNELDPAYLENLITDLKIDMVVDPHLRGSTNHFEDAVENFVEASLSLDNTDDFLVAEDDQYVVSEDNRDYIESMVGIRPDFLEHRGNKFTEENIIETYGNIVGHNIRITDVSEDDKITLGYIDVLLDGNDEPSGYLTRIPWVGLKMDSGSRIYNRIMLGDMQIVSVYEFRGLLSMYNFLNRRADQGVSMERWEEYRDPVTGEITLLLPPSSLTSPRKEATYANASFGSQPKGRDQKK